MAGAFRIVIVTVSISIWTSTVCRPICAHDGPPSAASPNSGRKRLDDETRERVELYERAFKLQTKLGDSFPTTVTGVDRLFQGVLGRRPTTHESIATIETIIELIKDPELIEKAQLLLENESTDKENSSRPHAPTDERGPPSSDELPSDPAEEISRLRREHKVLHAKLGAFHPDVKRAHRRLRSSLHSALVGTWRMEETDNAKSGNLVIELESTRFGGRVLVLHFEDVSGKVQKGLFFVRRESTFQLLVTSELTPHEWVGFYELKNDALTLNFTGLNNVIDGPGLVGQRKRIPESEWRRITEKEFAPRNLKGTYRKVPATEVDMSPTGRSR